MKPEKLTEIFQSLGKFAKVEIFKLVLRLNIITFNLTDSSALLQRCLFLSCYCKVMKQV